MNNKKYIYILLIIIIFLFVIFVFYKKTSNKVLIPSSSSSRENSQQIQYQTQTDNNGEVNVEVTPKSLSPDSEAQFDLVFNTHSVELDYDLVKISQLIDDKGEMYKPIFWSGGKGGHHLEGELIFPAISKSAKIVTLTIPGIDNKDRVFSWNVQ